MIYLIIAAVILFIAAVAELIYIFSVKKKLNKICCILDEIKAGNSDRRLYAAENDPCRNLVYKINDIVIDNKEKIIELNKAEKSYRELVTSLSHDIRTPMVSIIGYLDVLENENVSLTEQAEFLKITKSKALNLNEYIVTLFDWLKLESGEWIYTFESQNICELSRTILADWIMKLESNHFSYSFDIPEEPIEIITDKHAYERILNNIISNIIKHSKAEKLTFSLYKDNENVKIEIKDNGIGIRVEDLPHIFERLYKCDNARSEQSNGLGLSIAKKLTSTLNGDIYAKSELNKGTAFYLTLPLKHK